MKISRNVLVFLLILPTLFSCEPQEKTKRDYEDYKEFNSNLLEFYDLDESNYFYYIYRADCPDCVLSKGYVLDYLDLYKEDNSLTKLYLCEVHHINSEEGKEERNNFKDKPIDYNGKDKEIENLIYEMIGATNLKETYFFGTPSLYVIKDKKLDDCIVGYKKIKKYLQDF